VTVERIAYLLAVAGPVVRYLVSIAVDGVKDAATAELSDRVRPVLPKKTAAPDGQARILADAVVASLITRS